MSEKLKENGKPNHYRIYFPPMPFSVKESWNPNEKDGDFIRRAVKKVESTKKQVSEMMARIDASAFADWLKELKIIPEDACTPQIGVDLAPLTDYIDAAISDLEQRLIKRLTPLEDFFETVVKPTHAKESLKKQKEREEDVKIAEIAKTKGEQRKEALKRLILKGDEK